MNSLIELFSSKPKQIPLVKKSSSFSQLSAVEFFDKLFDKFDSNRDGRLTMFEFYEAIKYLTKVIGTVLPKRHDLEDIFARIDENGDNSVTRDEYRKLTKCLNGLIQGGRVTLLCRSVSN